MEEFRKSEFFGHGLPSKEPRNLKIMVNVRTSRSLSCTLCHQSISKNSSSARQFSCVFISSETSEAGENDLKRLFQHPSITEQCASICFTLLGGRIMFSGILISGFRFTFEQAASQTRSTDFPDR